jgi:hypothetical protein
MANYAFGINPIPDVANGHVFNGDNFTQLNPHTPILVGKTGLKFRNCNLTNCDPPADSSYDGCQPRHCEFCSNMNPEWIEKYGLTQCSQNCIHVKSTDTITIDGIAVDVTYYYEVKAVE